eukprot:7583518-Pyramimonas_sp.AAC.1
MVMRMMMVMLSTMMVVVAMITITITAMVMLMMLVMMVEMIRKMRMWMARRTDVRSRVSAARVILTTQHRCASHPRTIKHVTPQGDLLAIGCTVVAH